MIKHQHDRLIKYRNSIQKGNLNDGNSNDDNDGNSNDDKLNLSVLDPLIHVNIHESLVADLMDQSALLGNSLELEEFIISICVHQELNDGDRLLTPWPSTLQQELPIYMEFLKFQEENFMKSKLKSLVAPLQRPQSVKLLILHDYDAQGLFRGNHFHLIDQYFSPLVPKTRNLQWSHVLLKDYSLEIPLCVSDGDLPQNEDTVTDLLAGKEFSITLPNRTTLFPLDSPQNALDVEALIFPVAHSISRMPDQIEAPFYSHLQQYHQDDYSTLNLTLKPFELTSHDNHPRITLGCKRKAVDDILKAQFNHVSYKRIHVQEPKTPRFHATDTPPVLWINTAIPSLKPLEVLESSLLQFDSVYLLERFSEQFPPVSLDPFQECPIFLNGRINDSLFFVDSFTRHEMMILDSDEDESLCFQSNPPTTQLHTQAKVQIPVKETLVPNSIEYFSASSGVDKFMTLRGKIGSAPLIVQEDVEMTSPQIVPIAMQQDVDDRDDAHSHSNTLESCYLDLERICTIEKNRDDRQRHRYIASSQIISNSTLFSLLETNFQVDLLEREMSCSGVIVDSDTFVVVIEKSQLPLDSNLAKSTVESIEFFKNSQLGLLLLRLASHFGKVHVIIQDFSLDGFVKDQPMVYPFTRPTIRSLSLLDMYAQLLLDSLKCRISTWWSYSLLQTATLIRKCGDASISDQEAQLNPPYFLSSKPTPQETFLSNFPGLNHFSSQLLLNKFGSLAQIATLDSDALVDGLGRWIQPLKLKLFHYLFHYGFPGC